MGLIDGNAIAQQVLTEVKAEVAKLTPVIPHVAFVRVGEDPASVSYVTKKQKTAAEVGMRASLKVFPENVSLAELYAHIDALNADPEVHGILIQAPLPKHLPESEVFNRVSPAKDVDGFHDRQSLMEPSLRCVRCTVSPRLRASSASAFCNSRRTRETKRPAA